MNGRRGERIGGGGGGGGIDECRRREEKEWGGGGERVESVEGGEIQSGSWEDQGERSTCRKIEYEERGVANAENENGNEENGGMKEKL